MMTANPLLRTLGMIFLCGLTAVGCGLFDTRIPDDPSGPPPRRVPSDPDSVLYNYEIAVEYRTSGASQLSEALADSFVMVLDTPDANELGIPFVPRIEFEKANRDWQTLRVGPNGVRMNFDNVSVRPLITDKLAFYDNLPYEIELFNSGGTVERIAGFADLTMIRDVNWAMLEWRDIADQDGATQTYGYYMGFYSGLAAPSAISR